ncbi:hypothetical protein DQ04_02781010 [Trypanosoma grayi]|uniref:hypothetical protein n=1 Tax=Trypanosoma grayi TaxID=71804 RepID=UPI0004F4AEC9|nr:hypothetical protein DQ04_02781010 [Trypanosoma grayi]KEG11279.1 hypothetical protein DQ04_02781010 [Trypanosoma grayi]
MDAKKAIIDAILQPSNTASRVAMKVRAGRMFLQDGMVRPSPKRGYMFLLLDPLMHNVELVWSSDDGEEQHRVLLPPDKVKVSWVEKCNTGRVMLFDVKNGNQLFFFWMQSISTELDDLVMKRVEYILYKYRHVSDSTRNPREITISTLQQLLGEVWEEGLAQDVDLVDLLASHSLHSILREDPEFYASRMQKYLPPQTIAQGGCVNPIDIVQESPVKWAAQLMTIMLRRKNTHECLSTSFLDGAMPSNVSVTSFLMCIAQNAARQGEQQQQRDQAGQKDGDARKGRPSR